MAGPGRIENLVPFKPGHDDRRGSKPKGAKHISTWIQDLTNDEEFEATILDAKKGYVDYKGAPLKAIIGVAIQKSLAGDKQWADWLAIHGWKQQLDITSNGKTLAAHPLLGDMETNVPSDERNPEGHGTTEET